MDVNKKDRTQLKAYFVKNAVPTESNFADLIDATLNQKDDGIVKPAGDPLSIEAAGDATSQKKAINFYDSFTDANPAWVLSLNPRTTAGDPATARAGFSVGDGGGTSRLFIDRTTRNLGIGTTTPQAPLSVVGAEMAVRQSFTTSDAQNSTFRVAHPASRVLALGGNTDHKLQIGGFQNDGSDFTPRLVVDTAGNVGIGTTHPATRLDVAGTIRGSELRTMLHSAGGTASRSLSSSNTWQDFPELEKTFSLAAETNVLVFYQIAMGGGNNHLCTRLAVDGSVQSDSRSITGNTGYWSPSAVWIGTLAAGSHTVKVQYRTPQGGTSTPSDDWQARVLKVLVFGS